MSYREEVEGVHWPEERILPAFQRPQKLLICETRSASWEAQLSITTLVGLVNRPQPRVYLSSSDDDAFWLREALAAIPQAMAPFHNDDALTGLVRMFREGVQGMVVYDPQCIDSVNIATMMAGQRDGFVVSPGLARVLGEQFSLPVLEDLRAYGWKSRVEVNEWARQHLLTNASGRLVAGQDPRNVTNLRSFLVAARIFVYYLDTRKVAPRRRDGWRSERGLARAIFKACAAGGAHLGWFIDEPSGVDLASQAALMVLATDHFSNLEVWTSVQPAAPLPKRRQAEPPPLIRKKIFVSFMMSEGDNLQYNQKRMRRLWLDEGRGSVPIGWTIAPLLAEAAPAMAEYYARTATNNDEFVAGPSGAGYIYPSRWPQELLPSFLTLTGRHMRAMDMVTLEALDTNLLLRGRVPYLFNLGYGMGFTKRRVQRYFLQQLAAYGVGGMFSGAWTLWPRWTFVRGGMPVCQNLGQATSPQMAVRLIKAAARLQRRRPLFLNLYILAWNMTPTDLKKVKELLGEGYEIVTPSALLTLLEQSKTR